MAKLSDLKQLLTAAEAARPPPAPLAATPARAAKGDQRAVAGKRSVAAGKHADVAIDLAQAFADVARLPQANRTAQAPVRPAPIPRHTLADERDVLYAAKYGDDPAPQTWDIGQEFEHEQTYVRAGIGPDVLAKLRRGHWSVQAELDLHGLTSDEAHDALSDFVVDARNRGLRCVRVIHGKGLTSHNKEPVLKGKARRWLAHWDGVLAYVEAPRHAGGSGAMLVLLKGS